jgi:hypothetical protein
VIEPLEPSHRAKLRAALAAAGPILEFDAIERRGSEVVLLWRGHELAKLSADAFGLLELEAREGFDVARAKAQGQTRPRRCPACRGRRLQPRYLPLARANCADPYHSPPPEAAQ